MNFPNSTNLPSSNSSSELLISRRDNDDDEDNTTAVLLDLLDSNAVMPTTTTTTTTTQSSSFSSKQMDILSNQFLLFEEDSSMMMMMSPDASSSLLESVIAKRQVQGISDFPPDIYQEDYDSDVGPRILSTPICLKLDSSYQYDDAVVGFCCSSSSSSCSQHQEDLNLIESAAAFYNQALFHHVQGQLLQAKHMYHSLVNTIQNLLLRSCNNNTISSSSMPLTCLLEMGMRVHNNLGLILYNQAGGDNDMLTSARTHFQAALLFSKQLIAVPQATPSNQLEHATILSNWCRVNWMRGGSGSSFGDNHNHHHNMINENLYTSLREILRIRSSLLSWDHPDIAAAHYNLAVAEYARQMSPHQAIEHLMQYLHVAAVHHVQQQHSVVVLDPMPALIYLLLLQNEDKDDSMSQELVRGLRTLQDKRSSWTSSSNSSGCHDNAIADVASVLNFIGTLLFHKQDLEHALLFFQEELRLEEQMLLVDNKQQQGDISVSVTCNNIGRILQELEKYEDAIVYYERALKAQYGDTIQDKSSSTCNTTTTTTTTTNHPNAESCSAAVNLYSTVWYNLGLIHDKRGCYGEAIVAFKMSLELRSSMLGRDHPDIACLYYNIGVLQMEQQQLSDASESLREALRVRCQQGDVAANAAVTTTAGSSQLNDERVIKTLEKLASLHKNNGAILPAIDALRQVIRIIQVSTEYDTMTRVKDLGLVLRSIAELYHTMGDANSALIAALHSVRQLEYVAVTMYNNNQQQQQQQDEQLAHYFNIEQLISSLLLVGSLHHEMNEPILADAIFRQAMIILESTIIAGGASSSQSLPSSLYALREVAAMLATTHCAPVA